MSAKLVGDFMEKGNFNLVMKYAIPVKLFWRKSGNSRFSLKPKQQE